MADLEVRRAKTTDLNSAVDTFSVSPVTTDGVADQKETYYDHSKANEYRGYYKTIPEFKTAINGFSTWVIGKGWYTDSRTTAILENLTGWGEDTFLSIMWNMIVTKKVQGDAFAEIIRNEDGTLINLKPLDTGTIRIVVDKKGIILRYDQMSKTGSSEVVQSFQPSEMLHLCNDRIEDEIHGTAITESIQWVIDARQEAMHDLRLMIHRSKALGAIEIDTEDETKRDEVIGQVESMINNGDLLSYPKGTMEIKEVNLTRVQIQEIISWIRYLENFFYQALGVPKVILGGSEEFTEASSKIGYLTFEQVYSKEVTELIADLWNQAAIRVEFNKPASIKNELLNSEDKNTGQVGFQPKEATAGLARE